MESRSRVGVIFYLHRRSLKNELHEVSCCGFMSSSAKEPFCQTFFRTTSAPTEETKPEPEPELFSKKPEPYQTCTKSSFLVVNAYSYMLATARNFINVLLPSAWTPKICYWKLFEKDDDRVCSSVHNKSCRSMHRSYLAATFVFGSIYGWSLWVNSLPALAFWAGTHPWGLDVLVEGRTNLPKRDKCPGSTLLAHVHIHSSSA